MPTRLRRSTLAAALLLGCHVNPEGRYTGEATGAHGEREEWVVVVDERAEGFAGELSVRGAGGSSARQLRNVAVGGRSVSFQAGDLACVSELSGSRLTGECSSRGEPAWRFAVKRPCACGRW